MHNGQARYFCTTFCLHESQYLTQPCLTPINFTWYLPEKNTVFPDFYTVFITFSDRHWSFLLIFHPTVKRFDWQRLTVVGVVNAQCIGIVLSIARDRILIDQQSINQSNNQSLSNQKLQLDVRRRVLCASGRKVLFPAYCRLFYSNVELWPFNPKI